VRSVYEYEWEKTHEKPLPASFPVRDFYPANQTALSAKNKVQTGALPVWTLKMRLSNVRPLSISSFSED
jgi:hypothetical protein